MLHPEIHLHCTVLEPFCKLALGARAGREQRIRKSVCHFHKEKGKRRLVGSIFNFHTGKLRLGRVLDCHAARRKDKMSLYPAAGEAAQAVYDEGYAVLEFLNIQYDDILSWDIMYDIASMTLPYPAH